MKEGKLLKEKKPSFLKRERMMFPEGIKKKKSVPVHFLAKLQIKVVVLLTDNGEATLRLEK